MVNYYAAIHEATEGLVQKEKVITHSWKCKPNKIVEVSMNVTINEEKIKILNVRNSVKKLGDYASASLSWKDEFDHVKQNIKSSIKKSMAADMKSYHVCLYFNTHMLTNVFWMWDYYF